MIRKPLSKLQFCRTPALANPRQASSPLCRLVTWLDIQPATQSPP